MSSVLASPPSSGLPLVASLAAVTWDFRLVGRTRMLTEAWVRLGHPTVFVQVPSLRTAVERLLVPLRAREAAPVVRPWPGYPARWWHALGPERLTRALRRRAVALRRQLERRLDWRQAVALVVSPVWTPWLTELPFHHVVYDCIDELAVQVPRPELSALYRAWEDELVARAAGAVVTAAGLGAGLRARRPDLPLALIRNGVDVQRFAHLAAQTPRPADVPARGRPVIGFVGALYEWIDWELMRATAAALADCDFVLVGPIDGRGDVSRVADLPNVRLLGPQPYSRVPAYVQAFDVCWVPFKQDAIGRAANPVKIYEYLALGKPVVTTPVADTESFGDLVYVAQDVAEMVAHLRAAQSDADARAAARIAFAQQNSWDVRAREYLDFLGALSARG